MGFLETNLESIIYKNADKARDRGLKIFDHEKVYRQLRLGNYGIADLVGLDVNPEFNGQKIIITVYELKKDQINIDTLSQAIRYVTGLSRIVGSMFNCIPYAEYHICLIGKKVNDQFKLFEFIGNMGNIHAYTYDYDVDGIRFTEQSKYRLSNEGLPAASIEFEHDLFNMLYNAHQTIHADGHQLEPIPVEIPF